MSFPEQIGAYIRLRHLALVAVFIILSGITFVSFLALTAARAAAGFDFADERVALSGDTGPIPKGETAAYSAVITNSGNADSVGTSLSFSTYRQFGNQPVDNKFVSVQTSQGSCQPRNFDSKFGTYFGYECEIGTIAQGGSAVVQATVQINESMRLNVFIHDQPEGGSDSVTTLVNAPPVSSGSDKIKVGGLPSACASSDFTLKVKAKGAKKLAARLRGPLTIDGKPIGGISGGQNLGKVVGSKLSAAIDVGSLDPAYYEALFSAKYENGPKQKSSVTFQRC